MQCTSINEIDMILNLHQQFLSKGKSIKSNKQKQQEITPGEGGRKKEKYIIKMFYFISNNSQFSEQVETRKIKEGVKHEKIPEVEEKPSTSSLIKNKNKNIYLSFSRHTYIIKNAQQTQFEYVCNISIKLTGTQACNILSTPCWAPIQRFK